MADDLEILTQVEHAEAQAEALLVNYIEFWEDDTIHLSEKGVKKAFELIRERPVLERYLYILLLKAIEETTGLLKGNK